MIAMANEINKLKIKNNYFFEEVYHHKSLEVYLYINC